MRQPNRFYSLLLLLPVLARFAQNDPGMEKVFQPEDSLRIRIERLNMNSEGSDFSPALVHDTLFFVSGRPAKAGVKYSGLQGTELTDLYYALKRDSINFLKTKAIPGLINTRFSEGPFTLSGNRSVMCFSGAAKPEAGAKNCSAFANLHFEKTERPLACSTACTVLPGGLLQLSSCIFG